MFSIQNWEAAASVVDDLATFLKHIHPEAAMDLRAVAQLLPRIKGRVPVDGWCPFCEEWAYVRQSWRFGDWKLERIRWKARVVKKICPNSDEYEAGYRTLWRCDHCGEMELR